MPALLEHRATVIFPSFLGDGMLNVSILGKFEVRQDKEEAFIRSRAAQALLSYLVLNSGKSYRRENLSAQLWSDTDEVKARNYLRQTLWRLRQSIGNVFLRTDKISIKWNTEADYELDVDVLRMDLPATPSADQLIRVVSVYEGYLLPGFYDEWVMPIQKQMQGLFEDRMQLLVEQLLQEKRWREAKDWAEWWISMGTVPEPAYRALMKASAGMGDGSGVVAAFQRCTEELNEEIGVAPSPETHALLQRLQHPERLSSETVALTPFKPQVRLPSQPTPFIGRQKELRLLSTLLADPCSQLITILGPGGIGKTRLAIETAGAQPDLFPDGIYFVSLATLNEPAHIVSQIADAIGFISRVPNQGIRYIHDPRNKQLLTYMQGKQMLLVMDNVDPLAANDQGNTEIIQNKTSGLISAILREAPSIRILATSRERLHLQGETSFFLEGLTYPGRSTIQGADDLQSYNAIRLFMKQAQRHDPRFILTPKNRDHIIEICRRIDGMPLAIELSAAWIAMLTPAEIAEEI